MLSITKWRCRDMTKEQIDEAKESLIFIARRITDRQIASLIKEELEAESKKDEFKIYRLTFRDLSKNTASEPLLSMQEQQSKESGVSHEIVGRFDDKKPISVESPDQQYSLHILVYDPDWENQTFQISASIIGNSRDEKSLDASARYDFPLTWYTFPFTDNTLLADGNRFSLVLNNVDTESKTMVIKLVWFPKGFFTPRERPINHREFFKMAGLKFKGS